MNYLEEGLNREERKDVSAFVGWNQLPSEAGRRRMLDQWGINHIEECAGALILSKMIHEFLSTYIPEEIELITESDMNHNKLFTTRGDTRSYEHEKVGKCNDTKKEEGTVHHQKEKEKTTGKKYAAKVIVLETEAVADDDSNNDIRESEPLISREVVFKKQGGEIITSTYPWPFSFWTAAAAKSTVKLR
jgi:hypothetical protein